jgi:uncharacterized protein
MYQGAELVKMNREQIIATLRSHETELKAAGVLGVSVFGSTGRGDAGEDSDIDVAVRLGKDFSDPGLDYFGRLQELEQHLSQMLGCKVDVVEEPVRKQRFQTGIDRDRALAF